MFKDEPSKNNNDVGAATEVASPLVRQHTRRLSDKLLIAFHQACDIGDLEVAEQLLVILENMLSKLPNYKASDQRRNLESLVAAFERLWNLRRPER